VDTKVPPNHRIDMELFSILEFPLSAFAGVAARVESLRGRMGKGLFESLLAQSFDGGRWKNTVNGLSSTVCIAGMVL
jgi:hypothetical protein